MGGEVHEHIKLGPTEWDVYSLAAHTAGSHALVSREYNYMFTGDALGSGCGWVSNLVDLKKNTAALVEKVSDMDNPIVYTAHRWQAAQQMAHSNNIAVQEAGIDYIKEMVSLLGHISQKNYEINDDYPFASETQKAIYTTDADLNTDGIYPGLFSSVKGIEALIKEYFQFSDVKDPEKYYYDPVYWAFKNDITTGTSPTTFTPEGKVSRAQIVTFLYRAAGEPEVSGDMPYTDVKEGKYFYNAVLWAVENNITTGLTETTFGPDEKCTRGQIVTFLHRFRGEPEAEIELPFTDVKAGAYYEKAVKWAYANDITTGISATKFSPNGSCTRAQSVIFLYRTCAE